MPAICNRISAPSPIDHPLIEIVDVWRIHLGEAGERCCSLAEDAFLLAIDSGKHHVEYLSLFLVLDLHCLVV
jgi:hypothetical protein